MNATELFESPARSQTDDSVRRYFREIGAIPLLTRAQEADLGRGMERGRLRRARAISLSTLVQQRVIGLLAQLSAGTIDPNDVLEQSNPGDDDLFAEVNRRYAEVCRFQSESECLSPDDPDQRRLLGCLRRARVSAARSIRKIPFCPAQWNDFIRELRISSGSDELRSTLSRIRRGEQEIQQAKAELVKANLRLVVSVARRHLHRGMHLLDLVQEGNLGLMRAADRFDYRRGYKFSTYAICWIMQAITRALSEQSRTIRIPVNVNDQLNKYYRVSRELEKELGRLPADVEIANHMQISERKVQGLRLLSREPVSLDTPVGTDDSSTLGDLIADRGSASPVETWLAAEVHHGTVSILKTLIPKEEQVLRMRFGLGCAREYTLEEIGRGLAVTRERVRRIELKALRKLRQTDNARLLRGLLA